MTVPIGQWNGGVAWQVRGRTKGGWKQKDVLRISVFPPFPQGAGSLAGREEHRKNSVISVGTKVCTRYSVGSEEGVVVEESEKALYER